MISAISKWSQSIIIAIVIGSIITMILPEGKNKKYIKMIIGVYILFTILTPVLGKKLDLSKYDLNQYIPSMAEVESPNNTTQYNDNVKQLFISKVKKNITAELKAKGYEAETINIQTDDECNINKIEISQLEEYSKESREINQVKIEINQNTEKEEKVKGIATSDKLTIIEHLSETYKIDKSKIIIEWQNGGRNNEW